MRRTVIVLALSAIGTIFGCDFFSEPDLDLSGDPGPILFVSDRTGEPQLYSMQPDGSDVRRHIHNRDYQIKSASWSPDGEWILVKGGPIQEGKTLSSTLYVYDFDGRVRQSCPNILDTIWRLDERIVWSPASTNSGHGPGTIYSQEFIIETPNCETKRFSEVDSAYRTVLTDASNDGQTILGETLYREPGAEYRNGVWDIRTSFWTSGGDSLYSLGDFRSQYLGSIWSSNEEFLAVGIKTETYHRLYRMKADGTDLVQLTGDEFNAVFPISWSDDDEQILARARRSTELRWRIIMVETNGGGVKDLSPFPGASSYPTSWLTN